ncbi:hypothetical protein T4C_10739 [Trichinella pseudospiralis]|uniref:Uncharacterized protein n=1 Tax=Trichinella pseudospiralis TaxID=6337 RepID=A0A0V1JQV7_TRIPS|nr:hypothetical protein T4C_10739 [Trichinella pseudospiralis]
MKASKTIIFRTFGKTLFHTICKSRMDLVTCCHIAYFTRYCINHLWN